MKVNRIASIPLVLHDPYFSIWSSYDHLNDGDTTHWCGKKQRIKGYITLDQRTYCFMGDREFNDIIEQKEIEVTATATKYTFENDMAILTVSFRSPLLLDDPMLVSRPCTYIDFNVSPKSKISDIQIKMIVTADVVTSSPTSLCIGGQYDFGSFQYAVFGKAKQAPLNHSGDNVTIDWGNCYLAANEKGTSIHFDSKKQHLLADIILSDDKLDAGLVLAYDDLLSINYFGEWKKAYWTEVYPDILHAIEASIQDKVELEEKCKKFDQDLELKAKNLVDDDYALLCNLSYRQAIAAHKLITDNDGNIIFLSKENDSNGCIGTVDVSYPSVPLFMMFNQDYVKGMLRPIFKFAACDVWEYDFAPHDVGRYPYASGQVYGLKDKCLDLDLSIRKELVYPFYYSYPKGSDVYDLKYQMPVEECGNMIILTAAVCHMDGNAEFAKPFYSILEQWTKYLLQYGADPGEQLCTDDFAGHLSHNVNLSAKAIMGIEAFSLLSKQLGNVENSNKYHNIAVEMAKEWEKLAKTEDHTTLAFGQPETWSLKYNLIWDKFFGCGLFSEKIYDNEINYYIKKTNEYGVPLDSRKDYTKSDWILWCAVMTEDKEKQRALIAPIANYLQNTKSRVPFSDWYDTVKGEYCHFIARSVQGGIFMPMLFSQMNQK